MIAVDTNVLVRLLIWDDSVQGARAKALLSAQEVFVAKTVLLETEWVLRSLYGLDRQRIIAALRGLVGLPRLRYEDSAAVTQALDCAELGLDFADALHLCSSAGAPRFATFDERLRKRAGGCGTAEVIGLADLGAD